MDTLGVRDRWQLCLARVNLLHKGYLQVKKGSGCLSTSLRMLCVQSHHTAKQFRVFAITSIKQGTFCKEFLK